MTTSFGIGAIARKAFALAWRLIPAAALLSVFFVMPGQLAWLGLFGLFPLALALGGEGCGCHGRPQISVWPSL